MSFIYTYTKQRVRDEEGCLGNTAMSITMNKKQLEKTLLNLYRNGYKKGDVVVHFINQLLEVLEKEPKKEPDEKTVAIHTGEYSAQDLRKLLEELEG